MANSYYLTHLTIIGQLLYYENERVQLDPKIYYAQFYMKS